MIMYRFAFGVLSLVTLIGVSTTSAAFSDVPSNSSEADAVQYLESEGIIKGYDDGTFRPVADINRAEFTKIVIGGVYDQKQIDVCIATSSTTEIFPDVDNSDDWFAPYVCMAHRHGIVSGYPNGLFGPERTINFAEAAKILARSYNLTIQPQSLWYEGYVRALANVHAIPMSVRTIDEQTSRGDMAEMIYRLRDSITTKSSRTFEELSTGGCVRAGCSSQLCIDASEVDGISTSCEWREVYSCYNSATCERQSNGGCGFTPTTQLSQCIAEKSEIEKYTDLCRDVICSDPRTTCSNGQCIPVPSGTNGQYEWCEDTGACELPCVPSSEHPNGCTNVPKSCCTQSGGCGPSCPQVSQTSCVRAGCYAELCVDERDAESVTPTCQEREMPAAFLCYRQSVCERQANGSCGWAITPEFTQCLSKIPYDSCASQYCPNGYSDCISGKCLAPPDSQ